MEGFIILRDAEIYVVLRFLHEIKSQQPSKAKLLTSLCFE